MAFNKGLGFQSSKMTGAQKSWYAPDGDHATVTITIIDDSHFTKSETQVQVRRGELARRLLSAITGGPGYNIVKSNDCALADTGRVRRAVWEKLFPDEQVVTGTSMKKSEPVKKSAQDRMLEAVAELDQLVERVKRGEER